MTYLDWAGTSPPDAALLSEAASLAAECYGNPSSAHAAGRAAREKLNEARRGLLAALRYKAVDAPSRETAVPGLVFTASGSEADCIPLLALVRAKLRPGSNPQKSPHVLISGIEHPAVYEQAELLSSLGIALSIVNPGSDGLVSPAAMAEALRPQTALVALMAVNNETGAVQPLAETVSRIRKAANDMGRQPPRIHADAVQALGKIEFCPERLGLDSAAFSAHKIRGPRGIGALWLASPLAPLAVGGGQEGGQRPGSENLQGAWAFARAASAALLDREKNRQAALALEARLFAGLSAIPGAEPLPLGRVPGDAAYSPFILSVAFPGLAGEVFVRALSDVGIAVSTGSACSSNAKKKGRRVLSAMGLPEELAFSSIRISWGSESRKSDIDAFLDAAAKIYPRLKA